MRFVRTAENLFGLPTGFQRVEYLQSTGTQYIDTGYIASNTSGFRVDIMPLQASDKYFIGSRPRLNSDDRFLAGSNSGPQVYIGWNTNTFVNWTLNNVHTVQNNFMNSRTKVLDGTTIAQITSILLSQTTRTIYLFSANDANAVSMDTCRIYKVQISEGSSLVRDFIPCIDPLGVPCMYDLVGKKPYYNAGTGSFTYGRKIIPVEYLESTGAQWINTGIFPINEMEFESKFTFTSLVSTNLTVIGSRDSTKRCQPIGDYNNKWSASIGGSYDANGSSVSANTSYVVKSIISNGQTITLTVNGNQASVCTSTTGLPNQELYIFGRNFYGNTDPVDSRINAKMYFMKIKAANVLVRDFIPCKDENNVGFMFDTLSGTVYLNAGTGAFSVGENKYTAKLRLIKDTDEKVRFIKDVLPREYRPLKYLGSTGTQFILTGFTPTDNTDFELELSSNKTSTNWAMGCPTWVGVHYKGVDGQIGVTNSSTSDFQQYVNYARDNTRITMKLQGNTVYANGVSLGTITRRAGTLDFALFGYRDANRGATLLFTGSIYKCIIWNNGVPVRDLYPVLRKSDNKPGMYDRITKQFFVNQGTGEFNYG